MIRKVQLLFCWLIRFILLHRDWSITQAKQAAACNNDLFSGSIANRHRMGFRPLIWWRLGQVRHLRQSRWVCLIAHGMRSPGYEIVPSRQSRDGGQGRGHDHHWQGAHSWPCFLCKFSKWSCLNWLLQQGLIETLKIVEDENAAEGYFCDMDAVEGSADYPDDCDDEDGCVPVSTF